MLGLLERYSYKSGKAPSRILATYGLAAALFAGISLAIERARIQRLSGQNYQESTMTYGQYARTLRRCSLRREPPVAASDGGPDKDRDRGSFEELELEQYNSRSSLIPHSELTSPSQALPGRARTNPICFIFHALCRVVAPGFAVGIRQTPSLQDTMFLLASFLYRAVSRPK